MKRVVSIVVALACLALLSSCSLLPSPAFDDSKQLADAQMQHIADAVKHHDPDALKKLFSVRARKHAIDLDRGLEYFLTAFPSGRVTWEYTASSGSGATGDFRSTWVDFDRYTLSGGGKKYSVYFALFSRNTHDDPANVGIYALGIGPYTPNASTATGASEAFLVWTGQFGLDNDITSGNPGVYVPNARFGAAYDAGIRDR
jgi:hypothetical protein